MGTIFCYHVSVQRLEWDHICSERKYDMIRKPKEAHGKKAKWIALLVLAFTGVSIFGGTTAISAMEAAAGRILGTPDEFMIPLNRQRQRNRLKPKRRKMNTQWTIC